MKRLLVLSTIILFTLCVRAQTGMPKELTCTETAFNFSFSFGSGWKLTAPKMGPVEIPGNDADYNSLWRLKVKEVTAQTSSLPFLVKQSAVQKNEGLGLPHEPQFLLPKLNFTPPLSKVSNFGYNMPVVYNYPPAPAIGAFPPGASY